MILEENQDTQVEEELEEQDEGTEEEAEAEIKLTKAEYEELLKEKTTAASLKRDIKALKKEQEKAKEPEKNQSNEPDYAKLAYLKTNQVEHPDDQRLVMEEAARLKLPLTDVLQMEHIKARLASNNDARVSQDGMPKGSGRKGGTGKSTVEYYLAHPDEIPEDLELHNKVIDAKLKKETNSNTFSSTPFVG